MWKPVGAAAAIRRSLLRSARSYSSMLVQPFITVILLLFLYAGWHVRDEGNLSDGLEVAFVDTRAFRVKYRHDLEAAELQLELRHTAQTDKLIDELLTSLLARAPQAARVRLGVVHNGITGVTGVALLRFDVTNAVAAPGHSVGAPLINEPLSDWNDFLPVLLTGRCHLSSAKVEPNPALRSRLDALGANNFLACPVIDTKERMLAALFLTWDLNNLPPTGEALQSLTDFATGIGTQIAATLDQNGPLSPQYPSGE